jgi:chemotaxis-related protein WspB
MLFLQFQLGHDRYALDVRQVIEVLPLINVKRIPNAPAGVVGVINYRGSPVPLVDLSELMMGQPAKARMSTRIIVVNYPDENGEMRHHLGMIAEKTTQTVRREPTDFSEAGIDNPKTPYLGPVATDEQGIVQWVDATRLLPGAVRDVLFQEAVAEGQ